MPRKVRVFRHIPFEHLGRIADSLTSHRIEFEYAGPFDGGGFDLDGAAGLILMGGPMSANDDLAYLRAELELIERAAHKGLPILGICLGSQLIAKALGARVRVYVNRVKEIGWYPIEWTEAAERDALHSGLRGSETVFHWHGETFDLPAGAELLASSPACRNQAYRVGANIYGFQYHLEVTPEMIADWLDQDANCGVSSCRNHRSPSSDPGLNAARLAELGSQVFGPLVFAGA